ncbi:hypothetical protein PC128_g12458 [Phytophthora cactorum]|nr:hypothetical protein PC128_g12458 [Phytophthora cactorum]KAG4043845.1 hypothetical protein PC123_g20701 [Phytophthora cactorum]
MEPPDDTATSLSADHLAGVPQFSLPLPLAWADTVHQAAPSTKKDQEGSGVAVLRKLTVPVARKCANSRSGVS